MANSRSLGVNTFLSSKGSPTVVPREVIRATSEEKEYQINMLNELHKRHADKKDELLRKLQLSAVQNKNLFEDLMEAPRSIFRLDRLPERCLKWVANTEEICNNFFCTALKGRAEN